MLAHATMPALSVACWHRWIWWIRWIFRMQYNDVRHCMAPQRHAVRRWYTMTHQIRCERTLIETASGVYRFRVMASYLSKIANFNLPHLHLALPLGVTLFKFCWNLWHQKTIESMGYQVVFYAWSYV